MLTKKIATAVAAAGSLAIAVPAAGARPGHDEGTVAGMKRPLTSVPKPDLGCDDFGCGTNHSRSLLRQAGA